MCLPNFSIFIATAQMTRLIFNYQIFKNSTHLRLNIPLNVMDPQPLDMVTFLDKACWEMVLLSWLKRRPLQTMKTPNRPVYIC